MPPPPGSDRLLPVVVLDLARFDFLECDREVVLGAGLDHRRRELVERALAEVVVVGVDLAGALRGHDHTGVIGVDDLEEAVDARRDHELESSGRSNSPRTTSASSSVACSSRSLTATYSNSLSASSSSSAVASRASTSSGASVPRPTRRARSASTDGGAMNTCTASGIAARIWRAPCTSISSTTPAASAMRRSSSDRSVPYL